MFGKEQPGRLRCYCRLVTTSSLKKDEETNKLKQKHANEIASLKEEMNKMRDEMRHLFCQLLEKNPLFNVQEIPGCVGSNLASPVDASSAQAIRGQNVPHSSEAGHDSILQKVERHPSYPYQLFGFVSLFFNFVTWCQRNYSIVRVLVF
ncbi:hypothetical protein KY284_031952 [Solanum tuberosum]|nr:hypothetical protein KY284_031952 [Solanum tuberosum]